MRTFREVAQCCSIAVARPSLPRPDRSLRRDTEGREYLAPLDAKEAAEFERLIDLYDRGARMPLLSACMAGIGRLMKGWPEGVVDEEWRPSSATLTGAGYWH